MSADLPSVFAVQQGKRPSLCADFSWTFVGNSIYAGGQFAMLVLLAKLVRPELVGQYALGLAVVYPVMMFTKPADDVAGTHDYLRHHASPKV